MGWKEHTIMLYNRIAVEKHIYIATRAERISNSKLSNHSINDPTLLKRKENANDCTTSTWQGPKKNIEPFLAEQVGGSTEGRGSTCRQLRQDRRPICKQLRHRRQRGEDEQLEF